MSRNGSSTNGKLPEFSLPTSDTHRGRRTSAKIPRKFEVKRADTTSGIRRALISERNSSVRPLDSTCAEESKLRKKRVNVSSAPIYSASTSAARKNRARTWSASVRRLRSAEHEGFEAHSSPTSPGTHSFERKPTMATQEDTAFNSSGDHTSFLSGISVTKFQPVDTGETPTTLVLTRSERLPLKDFSAEIRASLDIETFIKEATFLLSLNGSDIDEILESMLTAVLSTPTRAGTPHLQGTGGTITANDGGIAEIEANQWSRTSASITSTLTRRFPLSFPSTSKYDLNKLIAEAKKSLLLQVNYEDHKYQRLAKTIKGVSVLDNHGLTTDQSWVCAMCSLNSISKRYLAMARLATPVNLGRSSEGTCLIVLIMTPTKEKGTKSEIEIGRTFATILSDPEFRSSLMYAAGEDEVKSLLWARAQELSVEQARYRRRSSNLAQAIQLALETEASSFIFSGIYGDLRRRIPHYWSDIKEGIYGKNTMRKTISTIIFLYFACLFPSIAFGVLNYNNTDGKIDATKMIVAQTLGGLCFGFFGGQPLIVLLSTAPLALYIKIVYAISRAFDVNFYALYGCVGLFNSLLLYVYACCGFSRWMRWSTRSTEEIFALFISVAFLFDAGKECYKTFQEYYVCHPVSNQVADLDRSVQSRLSNVTNPLNYVNSTKQSVNLSGDITHLVGGPGECERATALLYLLLLLGTVWLALYLFNFTKTASIILPIDCLKRATFYFSPFLTAGKRELLTDFALPISMLIMSLIGSLAFSDVKQKPFKVQSNRIQLRLAPLHTLSWQATLGAFGLALPISLLFYMEQNIASAVVNSPSNKLRKGPANHWDLFVVSSINVVLSAFCLPWVHAALPHSPLHVKALADIEERVDIGQHIKQIIVRVRETRLTVIVSHVLIGFSLFMIPVPLKYIPPAVLNGLFVYMAVTAAYDNQLLERVLLFFTEQSAYPPSHYLRRVPQRKVHLFTITQLIQLGLLCGIGFAPSPYVELAFPLLLVLQIVIRHKLIPRIIEPKYLDALDRSY
ncbi:Sodium bicarbonate transporter protein 11 [Fasciola hepatica]|uniref:Sodium bicarbonate transporter protein 11 n=1 Tax=Fasciola hepatica TaxID=6192 RepID=A0A4E0RMS8_FASHE|nr:Sodium bicarbonate transporter protein 11 [Fasciola hepatica]